MNKEKEYITKIDKKAVLILFLYIWIVAITIFINKDSLKKDYSIFASSIHYMFKSTQIINNSKEKNDINKSRKIQSSK